MNSSRHLDNSTGQHQHQNDPEHQNEPISMVSEISFPGHWHLALMEECPNVVMAIPLEEESEEFQLVSNLWRYSPQNDIPFIQKTLTKIVRIQNSRLWTSYYRKRQEMQYELGGGYVKERELFHGTAPENVDSICLEGFEVGRSPVHGNYFGRGVYFAKYQDGAHVYTYRRSATPCSPRATGYLENGHEAGSARQSSGPGSSTAPSQDSNRLYHYMFLSSVLVGVSGEGSHGRVRPPRINPLDPNSRRFDSCRVGTGLAKQFVVFDSHQAYPQYVIEYYTESVHNRSFKGLSERRQMKGPYSRRQA